MISKNFIGSKVISFQSETIFSKISKSKILTPHKIFWGTLGPPNFDTKNVHGISLCKKNWDPISNGVQMGASPTAHFSGEGGPTS